MPRHPLTDETLRILRAADEGRLIREATFRWTVEGEAAPLRAEREWLQRRGLLAYADSARTSLVLTAAGQAVLQTVRPGPSAGESARGSS